MRKRIAAFWKEAGEASTEYEGLLGIKLTSVLRVCPGEQYQGLWEDPHASPA